MLESKLHTGKRQSKVITIYNNVCLLFVLSQGDSSVLSNTAALHHMNGSRCKGPTAQFSFRLKCLPSNKNRSQASGSAFFTVKTSSSCAPCRAPCCEDQKCLVWVQGCTDTTAGGAVVYVKMAEMFVGRLTPLSILWACLHLALSHLSRYHCQNRATTGLLARVVFLKSTMTSTFSFFYIVTDSPKSHIHWSNYWHSVTGPEHGK